jgi:hypothetical protein
MIEVMKDFTKPFSSETFAPHAAPIAADAGRFRVRGWVYAGYIDDPQPNFESRRTEVAVLVGTSPNQGSSIFQVLATVKATGVLTRIEDKVQAMLGSTSRTLTPSDSLSLGEYPGGTQQSKQVLLFARDATNDPQYWWIDNRGDAQRPDLRMTRPPIPNTAVVALMFNLDALRVLRHARQAHRRLAGQPP